MTKRKKLKCVGWGIWLKKTMKLYKPCQRHGVAKDHKGIVWIYACGGGGFDMKRYERHRRKGYVIAKKLYVEV